MTTKQTSTQRIRAYWKKYRTRPVPISDTFWQSISAQQKAEQAILSPVQKKKTPRVFPHGPPL